MRQAVVTIGNFDGVHAAHRAILRRVVAIARGNDWTPTVLTFDPHPTRLVAPDRAPRLLSTPQERSAVMRKEGIERVMILPFTNEIASLSPEEFAKRILVDDLHASAVLVGENFRFGHKAAGDIKTLRMLGERYGFVTEAVAAVRRRGRVVSSSEVRRLVESGKVSLACRLLERPYTLEGEVVRGHGIGARQTVPTLNLRTAAEVLPARGVYITRTADLDSTRQWESITNVGFRPTFEGEELTIETFLLSPFEGHSPACIGVQFLRRVRDEKKFESPEALKTQILRDVDRARTYFRRLALWKSLRWYK